MKIIVNGACGHMGRALIAAAESKDIEIAAKVDKYGDTPFKEISEYKGCADAVVDFSHHTAAPALCAYAEERGLPLVIATTGHTEEEAECIRKAAQTVPVFYSANMSLGIALLIDLAKKAAAVFPDAELKVFVTASAEVRAQRRYDELKAKGMEADYASILKNVEERDYIDSHREVSPLRKADDAVELDNSRMTIAEQKQWLREKFEERAK